MKNGLRICTSSYTRHHVNISMTKAKANGHYINSMLALQEALRDGYDEALLLDVDGFVAVNIGSSFGYSNLEIVKAVNEYTDLTLDYDFGPARPGDPARLVCDNLRAIQTLNWNPEHSDLKNIIVTAEKWHKSLM